MKKVSALADKGGPAPPPSQGYVRVSAFREARSCSFADLRGGTGLNWNETMPTWAVPEYTSNQVDKAGAVLIDPKSTWEDYTHALQVINNWRSSHSYPLLNFA